MTVSHNRFCAIAVLALVVLLIPTSQDAGAIGFASAARREVGLTLWEIVLLYFTKLCLGQSQWGCDGRWR